MLFEKKKDKNLVKLNNANFGEEIVSNYFETTLKWYRYEQYKPKDGQYCLSLGKLLNNGKLTPVLMTSSYWEHKQAFDCSNMICEFWAEFPKPF